jgi:hypothetical protein
MGRQLPCTRRLFNRDAFGMGAVGCGWWVAKKEIPSTSVAMGKVRKRLNGKKIRDARAARVRKDWKSEIMSGELA